jgi:hypothetical protein
MLARVFPTPGKQPVKYVVRSHPHDFGPYREVSIAFADGNQAAVDFAWQVEAALPNAWGAVALDELAWFERRDAYAKAVREGSLLREEVPQHYAANSLPQLVPTAQFQDLLAARPLCYRVSIEGAPLGALSCREADLRLPGSPRQVASVAASVLPARPAVSAAR